jgi:transposase
MGCCGSCALGCAGRIFLSATASTRACIRGSAGGRLGECGQGLYRSGQGSEEPVSDAGLNDCAGTPASGYGQEKGASDAALGRSRGGLTTKIHLLADEHGLPVNFLLTGGQVHDCTQALPLLADRRPAALIADKGYDSETILQHLNQRGIEAVIPPRNNRIVQRSFDKNLYKQRNRIERTFAHLKQFRRFSTRFDRLRDYFKATVALTCAWLHLKLYVDTP